MQGSSAVRYEGTLRSLTFITLVRMEEIGCFDHNRVVGGAHPGRGEIEEAFQ